MIKRISPTPILSPIIICLTIAGCKKEKLEPLKERFPIEYRFINEGDNNVKSLVLDLTTFYPYDSVEKDGDSISFLHWRSMAINEVPVEGTLKIPEDRSGYATCTGQLKLAIWFKEALYSPLFAEKGRAGAGDLANGWTRVRTYIADPVTMQSASDGIIVFKWPSDTTQYSEVLYIIH